jgi:hypothetical protein
MNTIDKEMLEEQTEPSGWRRIVGSLLAFTGLMVFANVTIVALLFRQAVSLKVELLFIAAGGLIGVIGMMVRGDKKELLEPTIVTVAGGLIATLFVNFVSGQFGFLGILIFGAGMLWLVNKLFSRVED